MGSPSWIVHVESFVDPDRSPSQQAAGRDALVGLLIYKNLSISQVVKEMGDYLTTTDSAIRARGILLLGEMWAQLREQYLEDNIVHSFSVFFSSRLGDWHALHGALVGSLAVLRRRKSVGSVQEEDAKLFIESALENLEVQALAQQDRMFCLELLECLLCQHASAVAFFGERFIDGACTAIDGEKDPRCLLLAFRIVELVVQIFPDPNGPLQNLAEDLFGIISCYFPISFNPPPDDTRFVTREDLSVALMNCFASTKLFGQFCIPLLVEKLSSSLQSAKRDSLKYLSFCSQRFGADILKKNVSAIWNALKPELLPSQRATAMGERGEEVVIEALECLTFCIRASQEQNHDTAEKGENNSGLLQMILHDNFIDDFFKTLSTDLLSTDCDDGKTPCSIDSDSLHSDSCVTIDHASIRVKETACVLAAAIKASCSSCFAVLSRVFKQIFEVVKVPVHIKVDLLSLLKGLPFKYNLKICRSFSIATLEAIFLMLEATRTVAEEYILSSQNYGASNLSTQWMTPLQMCSDKVVVCFAAVIVAGLQNGSTSGSIPTEKIWEYGVAGLQTVASFPYVMPMVTDEQFEFTIDFLLSIILASFEVRSLWDKAVAALASICNTDEKYSVYNKRQEVRNLVIQTLLNEVLMDKHSLPLLLNFKALAAVSDRSPLTLAGLVKTFTEILCNNLRAAIQQGGDGNGSAEKVVPILQGLWQEFLPCCGSSESESDALLQLALSLWNISESFSPSSVLSSSHVLEGMMGVLQITMQKCSEQLQRSFLSKTFDSFVGRFSTESISKSCQDVWRIGLFGSVLVPLHSSIHVHEGREIIPIMLMAVTCPSCNPVANIASEAIGSILNKWHLNPAKMEDIDPSFVATVQMILKGEWLKNQLCFNHGGNNGESCRISFGKSELLQLKIRCIHLLGCMAKGIAMKGHITVSDIAILLLKLTQGNGSTLSQRKDFTLLNALLPEAEEVPTICFAAAEALGFILKDSGTFLNKNQHAVIKPLHKQRFFVSMLPPLIMMVREASMPGRVFLYHAFGNLVSVVPSTVLLIEVTKVLPLLLESVSALSREQRHSDALLSILLALSSILVDKSVRDYCSQHVPTIVDRLLALLQYPFSTMVRETALLCLGTVVVLPYARVFPVRPQVMRALVSALDDPKRIVRREAIRCRQAWYAINQ